MGNIVGNKAVVSVGFDHTATPPVVGTHLLGLVDVAIAARKLVEFKDCDGIRYLPDVPVGQFTANQLADFSNTDLEAAIANGTVISAECFVDGGTTPRKSFPSAYVTEDIKTGGPDQPVKRALLFGQAA